MFGSPRSIYFCYLAVTLLVGAVLAVWAPAWLLLWAVLAVLAVIGAQDLRSHHNVLRNYPILGHMRYMLEFVRPELRQYFFESEQSGRPFNREQRQIVHARANGQPDTSPFGTRRDVEDAGFNFVQHSIAPKKVDPRHARIMVGGPQCSAPYDSSRLNISAMSFGALSGNAVLAMNKGAKLGNFAQDTGEGAISPYHREHGGDIIWEIASAYFGCRFNGGTFDPDEFAEKACTDQVKMIEIKLSQGAKPGHGGLLPGSKVNAEIAETREIEQGKDCLSPAMHPEFDTPIGLLRFMQRLRELCGGKPVGFKLCLGKRDEFMGICKAMLETGIQPDFITVDGAEGGTGAAPAEFSDFVGTYINEALPFVHNCLVGIGKRDEIRIIASGKVAMGFDIVTKISLGADMCNAARAFMFSVGCIQAQRCHTNTCPTGVTTQDPARTKALDVESKALWVRNFHDATINSFLDIMGALGVDSPDELGPERIYHRPGHGPACTYRDLHPQVGTGDFLDDKIPEDYAGDWARASAQRF
ncbi:Glutamate synthase domain-containing protein 2 [Modicisalibacter muralis]|uniref:Glutamate synthase domain-containing protein 2 n=1 Tax=Modicisalibacter muralis TaxID=119000 RepID=A0A1G9LQ77_9GAMM|nr:FMN-binding glutamate synthase family protein [Halomonas muralis]SDL64182.1 Glutamate synthase domain-containing protein 2 [Halomonas muralis]